MNGRVQGWSKGPEVGPTPTQPFRSDSALDAEDAVRVRGKHHHSTQARIVSTGSTPGVRAKPGEHLMISSPLNLPLSFPLEPLLDPLPSSGRRRVTNLSP